MAWNRKKEQDSLAAFFRCGRLVGINHHRSKTSRTTRENGDEEESEHCTALLARPKEPQQDAERQLKTVVWRPRSWSRSLDILATDGRGCQRRRPRQKRRRKKVQNEL